MPEIEAKIKDVALKEELSKRYLSYAMSTIVSRSLPDVRDGLKPVHRRLLYAMRQLHLLATIKKPVHFTKLQLKCFSTRSIRF